MAKAYFSKELFQFLVELKFNNDRAWFQANKSRYEDFMKKPMLAFIEAFAKPLKRVNPAFVAEPRSMFRIYRDTRFAKDKTPYKTHAAAHFMHRAASDVHAPGFYLHIEPGESFIAAGMWSPEADALKLIRKAIMAHPRAWLPLSRMPLWGESYVRPPKGVDPAHRFIADLKRKHFISWVDLKDSEVLAADFMQRAAKAMKKLDKLNRFLCDALRLK